MNDLFKNYIENNFSDRIQCPVKKAQFEYNYKKYFQYNTDLICLDIGPGRGEMLSCMKNWNIKNFSAIDISPSVVEFCHSLNLPCEWVESSENYLKSKPEYYDIITLLDVLEHIPPSNTLHFLSAIYQALRPGGKVIIQVPNMQAEDATLYYYSDFTHCAGFTEHSFHQIFTTLKFSHFKCFPYEAFCYGGSKEFAAKILRPVFHFATKFRRKCIGSHCPSIITPVFYAVAIK